MQQHQKNSDLSQVTWYFAQTEGSRNSGRHSLPRASSSSAICLAGTLHSSTWVIKKSSCGSGHGTGTLVICLLLSGLAVGLGDELQALYCPCQTAIYSTYLFKLMGMRRVSSSSIGVPKCCC